MHILRAVADPDLQIRGCGGGGGGGGGGGHPDPEIRRVWSPRASVWSKNKGGGRRAPRAPPLDPLLVRRKEIGLL